MEIYLVRHGAALHKKDDPERHLSNEGIQQCRFAGKALNRFDVSLDVIISSPITRAIQTAEIISEETGYSKDNIKLTKDLEPNTPVKDAFTYLAKFGSSNRILITGHLPSIEIIASELLSGTEDMSSHFKTSGICRIDAEFLLSGTGELQWFLMPEHLRLIAESNASISEDE